MQCEFLRPEDTHRPKAIPHDRPGSDFEVTRLSCEAYELFRTTMGRIKSPAYSSEILMGESVA